MEMDGDGRGLTKVGNLRVRISGREQIDVL